MENFKELFREESLDILQKLEQHLMELEENSDDGEKISAAFRCMHTIKGNAAMFGFVGISRYAHELESVLDGLREGKVSVSKHLIDLLLTAADDIRDMLHSNEVPVGEQMGISDGIIQQLREIVGAADTADGLYSETPASRSSNPELDQDHECTYRIIFKPGENIFLSGTNPLLLLSELRELGELSCICNFKEMPSLREIDPEKSYVSWEIFLTTSAEINNIHDVFIFVQGSSEIAIHLIQEGPDFTEIDQNKKLGEILVERGDIDEEALSGALHSQKKIGELLVEEQVLPQSTVKAALAEQKHVRLINEKRGYKLQAAHVKVRAEKLDTLVDLVGELVTAQARLNQVSSGTDKQSLTAVAEQMERLISDLRDSTMSIRMLPIGATFNKFRRLARDLSGDLGKKVELIVEGGETELDKTVIERLQDPLVHLIRNCIDHGIETSRERKTLGKPETGIVRLSACHSGTSVLIRVEDDGSGLDREAILQKARIKGLIADDAHVPERELFDLIFSPGFSTAAELSDVSGRGVGMDVVRREIESLQGSISIASRKMKGTCITLNLPLTLAIIEGLLLFSGGQYFVLPLSVVEECVEFTGSDEAEKNHRKIVNVRGSAMPYIKLQDVFDLERRHLENKLIQQMIIIHTTEMRMGLVVDGVIGNYQTVIKPLGRIYRNVEGISGATILGDGSIALILDIIGLEKIAKQSTYAKVC